MNGTQSNIVAIASGKGGVGKTWLAITLAHLAARSGRRVLLFDGDIGLANVDVQLGLTAPKDLSHVIHGRHTLRDIILPYEPGRFDLIAGRSGSATLANIPIDKLADISMQLKALEKDYDLILIDLGAGVESHVRFLSSIARACLVVVTDEPTSLTDAYAFIKLLLSDAPPGGAPELGIVINQAATQKEGEKTWAALNKACSTFLNFSPPLTGVIRKDNKVKETIRAQSSLIARAPHTTAATDAAAVCIKLLQR